MTDHNFEKVDKEKFKSFIHKHREKLLHNCNAMVDPMVHEYVLSGTKRPEGLVAYVQEENYFIEYDRVK
jgi:hypothetical protein